MLKNKMKKTLLWIWIPSVLIIAVAGFVFFNIRNWESNQNIIENIKPNQEALPYHGTVKNDVEKRTQTDNECYGEDWNIVESPKYDVQGDIINCYDNNWYPKWKQITYHYNWKIKTIWIVENWNYTGYYENWQIFEEWHMFKDAFNSENNRKWFILIKDGKRIQYYENWNKEFEWTYKKWTTEWKWVYYYENWNKESEWSYKNWTAEWKWVYYYENWRIQGYWNLKDWVADGKRIEYYENWNKNFEWFLKEWIEEWKWILYSETWDIYIWTYENGEIVNLEWNINDLNIYGYYNYIWDLYERLLWNRLIQWKKISIDEFNSFKSFFPKLYDLYYGNSVDLDKKKERLKKSYNERKWYLLALYSMMNCSESPLNPDTYLFNLDDPKLAQETYFKNCPKWCKYVDEEGTDFVCE